MRQDIARVDSAFGTYKKSRQVKVIWNFWATFAAILDTSGGFYSDAILGWNNPSHPNRFMAQIMMHEYGHLLNYSIGMLDTVQALSHQGCASTYPRYAQAWQEGFADFIGTMSNGPRTVSDLQYSDTIDAYLLPRDDYDVEQAPCRRNGLANQWGGVGSGNIFDEYAIAGLLYDFYDNVGLKDGRTNLVDGDDDLVTWAPATWIAALMRTCKLGVDPWISGVDQFIYCAANNTQEYTYADIGGYMRHYSSFTASPPLPPAGWVRDKVRTTWAWDINGIVVPYPT